MWQLPLLILIAADFIAIVLLLAMMGRLRAVLAGPRSKSWLAAICVALLLLICATATLAWLAAHRRHAQSHYEAGLRLLRRGQVQEARDEFERHLAEHPDDPAAREALDKLRRRREAAGSARSHKLQIREPQAEAEGLSHPERRPSPLLLTAYQLDADIDPDAHTLSAVARLRLQAKRKPLRTFRLSLGEPLKVTRVTVAGSAAKFQRREDWVHITPLAKLDKRPTEVVISYSVQLTGQDEMLPGGDVISDRGVYLRPESRWYPALGYLEFRAPVKTTVTVPKAYYVVAPGALIAQQSLGAQTRFTWDCPQPANGIALAVGRFRSKTVPHGTITLGVHLFPEHSQWADDYLQEAGRILDFYSASFGPYPFGQFDVVEVPLFPGGYGPTSFVMLGEATVEDRDSLGPAFLAHEIAHQWWGSVVVPQGAGAGWLSEAFAEYSSFLYMEHCRGPAGLRRCLDKAKRGYHVATARGPEEPISYTDPMDQVGAYSGVIYSKGAFVLHMLRREIGDASFLKLLRTFAAKYAGGFAQLGDFRDLAEEVSGRKLGWFFDQWLNRSGTMEFSYQFTTRPLGRSRTRTTIDVFQETAQPYRAKLTIRLRLSSRVEDHEERIQGPTTRFTYLTDSPPLDIDFDPQGDLLLAPPRQRSAPSPAGNAER